MFVGNEVPRPLDRFLEPSGLEWLQEVIQRIHLERPKRVLIISRGEDHDGQQCLRDSSQHLKSIHVRHLHVEKDQVRLGCLDLVDRLKTILAFANDLHVRFFTQ